MSNRETSYRSANVLVQGELCGRIEETENGYCFQYESQYVKEGKPPVSLTMPLREKPYESSVLFPFFDGLIPEGYLLDLTVKNWKLQQSDRFGLMLVSCRDCIGDAVILPVERGEEADE